MKLLSFALLFISSLSYAEQFQAPLTHTQWQIIESPLECILSQPIEGFGEAKFIRRSGENFSLVFTSSSHPAIEGDAYFEIAEASWQNSEQRQLLEKLSTESNQTEFRLSGDLAKKALTRTQEGQFPTFRFRSHSSAEEISVFLSTVHFTDSLPAFKQCLANLHPDTFEQIRKLTVYYSLEGTTLSSDAQASLIRIAEYLKVDNSIKGISISGHTDNHGRKRLNVPLAEARAIAVKNFFIEQLEVAEELITISSHREFKPAQTNKTKLGRAHNRRAEIEVFK
ncbi:MAG: cell envelope biogenesis protein OmpA [Gammaproteobacteria bacterium]|nr:MAG: cell envelope biogenesis protein OmpA [Gammaproteobacteria bacterium]